MKLYTNSTRARAEHFYGADVTTPASAYRLQQQLLAAYREMSTWYDAYDLLELVYLPGSGGRQLVDQTTGRPLRGAMSKLDFDDWSRKQVRQAREKLAEMVPELVLALTTEELQTAAGIFLHRGLVPFIWHIFAIERGVQYRIEEGNSDTRLCDDGHAKAVGLGKTYTKPEPAKAPESIRPAPAPMLRTARRRKYNPHNPQQLWIWPPVETCPAGVTAGSL